VKNRHLVAMHPGEGGPRTPVFLVAGMFGNVLNLRHIANQIGRDRPFYGLQARGLYGGDGPHETFDEMAKDYIAEIRRVQPKGPYLIGGFSGGGLTALEIAHQLRDAGEDVPLLVMLDTPLPSDDPLTLRDKLEIHRQNLEKKRGRYLTEWVQNRVEWELKKWRDKRFDPTADTGDGEFHSKAIEQAFYRALTRYKVRFYPGTISLFRPKLTPTHVLGPNRQINKDKRFIYADNGWTPHCQRVDVYEVPGDHDSMVLEPNVRVVAARIRGLIVEAQKQVRGAIVVG
jgi:thioesterase domain-containing protein